MQIFVSDTARVHIQYITIFYEKDCGTSDIRPNSNLLTVTELPFNFFPSLILDQPSFLVGVFDDITDSKHFPLLLN